jgi:Putative prokaryotic signal transducing protein
MDNSKLEIVFKTQSSIEASIVSGLLKSNGIDAFILDEYGSRITGGIAIPSRVAVMPDKKEEALVIIKAFSSK